MIIDDGSSDKTIEVAEKNNVNYISSDELELVKDDVVLINMSRGGIINEKDLYNFLLTHPKASASIDVYDEEPYAGDLISLSNIYLTPHLGSCSVKSRFDMEVGAVEAINNFNNGKQLLNRIV